MLWLKDSLGTLILFSEADLAVAMKKATFLLCLSPLWSQCHRHPCWSIPSWNSPWCLFHSRIALSPTWATLVKNDCRKSSVSAGFITSAHGGQIHSIFDISYMLKPALLQQYKKGNWLTSQLALKTRSQAALSALRDSFPLLQSKTSHPVCRREEFTWAEFWLFLSQTGCALCRFLFNCRRKSFLL